MKYLLDTHLLIWAVSGSSRLPKEAIRLINKKSSELFFSAASLWEITLKAERHLSFEVDPRVMLRGLLDHGYIELPVTSRHGIAVLGLPVIHKDPFDRLLVAQAIVEGIMLLTVDAELAKYPGPVRLL